MRYLVQCNGCGASTETEDHQNPDAALKCGCCTKDHDHAANANAGDVCRPVTIGPLPGQIVLQPVSGV